MAQQPDHRLQVYHMEFQAYLFAVCDIEQMTTFTTHFCQYELRQHQWGL